MEAFFTTILASASLAETSGSFWSTALDVLLWVLACIGVICIVMCFAAVSVVAERKVSSFIQGRYGPNRTYIPLVVAIPFLGNFLKRNGLMQLAADGLKFLVKEDPLPSHVNKFWYMMAPAMSLAPVLITACVIPFGVYWDSQGAMHPLAAANFDVSLIFALAIGSLGVYGAVMAGWSSNNKFSYHGSIRASAQVISYELSMWLAVLPLVMMVAGRCDTPLSIFSIASLQTSSAWFCITQPLSSLIFLVALFAETNRLPFDMAESETDLVSGYHTEYGSFKFGLFFVGEYGHVALGSALFVALFLGAWNPLPWLCWPESWGWVSTLFSFATYMVKIAAMIFFFLWIRWTLPRFRYDQVMHIGWKILLPLGLANFVFYILIEAIF